MIKEINKAAEQVGITAIVTNSTEKIETQLNRITNAEQLPILLVSWDYEVNLEIDSNGFLNNPSTNIVCLLMTKAYSTEKSDMEEASELMGALFTNFVKTLNSNLRVQTRDGLNALSGISYTNVPRHGAGKHSGVLGRFSMRTKIIEDCFPKGCPVEVVEEVQTFLPTFNFTDNFNNNSPAPNFVLNQFYIRDSNGNDLPFNQGLNSSITLQNEIPITETIVIVFPNNSFIYHAGSFTVNNGSQRSFLYGGFTNDEVDVPVEYDS